VVKVPRVLIVDDQPNVRKALRRYFQELKLECSEAENGLDALQKAQQVKPDLIILDFSMPVMNGVEAAKVFKQVMPEVPILMLTAHFGVADEAAKDVGVLGVFSKENIAPLVKQTRTLLKMREL
jgi:two-component system, NtrC family, response regulator AtoC